MSTLPRLPKFSFEPNDEAVSPFDGLAERFRRADAGTQSRLDECVAMEDAVGAVVALTKLYLALDGPQPSQDSILNVLPLRDVAKSRNAAVN